MEHWVQRAWVQRIAVTGELVNHPLPIKFTFSRMVQDVQADQPTKRPSAALKLITPTEFWAAASGGAAKPADVDILAFRPASLLETSPEGHDVIHR
jgi:hypothetical protein